MQCDHRFISPEQGRCWVVPESDVYALIDHILLLGHTVTFHLEIFDGHVVVNLQEVSYDAVNLTSATPINYLDVYLTPALDKYLSATFTAQTGWFWVEDDASAPHLGSWMSDSFSS